MIKLRPYQQEIARAILASAEGRAGLTFSVEIARQGGKNELSAMLELVLLTLHLESGGTIIKASPTFRPQTVISMERLKQRLDDFGYGDIRRSEMGYIVSLGSARCVFLSAEENANVKGHTADLLLEMDEAQEIGPEKYTREFRPMGSASNCTAVLYGTTWDDASLLEQVKQSNLELAAKDGLRRHFRCDWQEVAKHNDDYRRYVESEKERLGENHPLFLTQYALVPIHGGARLFTSQQVALLRGGHPRRSEREEGKYYIAGIDLAGEEPPTEDYSTRLPRRARDATTIVIAEVSATPDTPLTPAIPAGAVCPPPLRAEAVGPRLNVVELYSWTGAEYSRVFEQTAHLVGEAWDCRRIVVDATGMGEPFASSLRKALGSRVQAFKFTQPSKSELGFNLLAAVNSGRLKLFKGDGSQQYQEMMTGLEKARVHYRPNRSMNFYVDPSEGHDDFLMALALVVEAARDLNPRPARVYQRH